MRGEILGAERRRFWHDEDKLEIVMLVGVGGVGGASVLSSKDRLEQIANDTIMDMELKPRLKANRGNAMLVAGSIPEACRFFEILRNSGSDLSGRCAIVTS
jgi:type I site-specific restriction-modification system R (restriction) subunit